MNAWSRFQSRHSRSVQRTISLVPGPRMSPKPRWVLLLPSVHNQKSTTRSQSIRNSMTKASKCWGRISKSQLLLDGLPYKTLVFLAYRRRDRKLSLTFSKEVERRGVRVAMCGLVRRTGGGRGAENHPGTKWEMSLTALSSRYNLQQSMLAPLSRFGSELASGCQRC